MSGGMYGAAGAGAGQAIFTDDVSLQVFMEHLKRLVRVNQFKLFNLGLPLIFGMLLELQAVGASTT